jgi:hypothetical protein
MSRPTSVSNMASSYITTKTDHTTQTYPRCGSFSTRQPQGKPRLVTIHYYHHHHHKKYYQVRNARPIHSRTWHTTAIRRAFDRHSTGVRQAFDGHSTGIRRAFDGHFAFLVMSFGHAVNLQLTGIRQKWLRKHCDKIQKMENLPPCKKLLSNDDKDNAEGDDPADTASIACLEDSDVPHLTRIITIMSFEHRVGE